MPFASSTRVVHLLHLQCSGACEPSKVSVQDYLDRITPDTKYEHLPTMRFQSAVEEMQLCHQNTHPTPCGLLLQQARLLKAACGMSHPFKNHPTKAEEFTQRQNTTMRSNNRWQHVVLPSCTFPSFPNWLARIYQEFIYFFHLCFSILRT